MVCVAFVLLEQSSNRRQLPVVESTDRTTGTYYNNTSDGSELIAFEILSIWGKRMDLGKSRFVRDVGFPKILTLYKVSSN